MPPAETWLMRLHGLAAYLALLGLSKSTDFTLEQVALRRPRAKPGEQGIGVRGRA